MTTYRSDTVINLGSRLVLFFNHRCKVDSTIGLVKCLMCLDFTPGAQEMCASSYGSWIPQIFDISTSSANERACILDMMRAL